jgi:hypothetical protein
VVCLVRRRQHFGLVYVVDLQSLEDLRLDEVAYPGLGHHRDRDSLLDLHDLLRVAHPGDPALHPYIRRHPLERHDRDGPRLLGYACLRSVHHVHDDPAFEHLGHTALYPERPG